MLNLKIEFLKYVNGKRFHFHFCGASIFLVVYKYVAHLIVHLSHIIKQNLPKRLV